MTNDSLVLDDAPPRTGLLKKAAKSAFVVLHRWLPASIYGKLYSATFRLHRWLVRRKYLRKLVRTRKSGNRDAIARTSLVYSVMPYSLVGTSGLESTYDLARSATDANLAGAFVECGIARGGCAALLATVAFEEGGERHCWFFDSFEGLPDPTEADTQNGSTGEHVTPLGKGDCLGTYEEVSALLFETRGLPREAIHLVRGWFQDSLPVHRTEIGPVALLRIDGDWYESTMCCLENLFDQVASGGWVVIDDYCSCYGAKKATDEFLSTRSLNPKMVPDGRGGCSFRKE